MIELFNTDSSRPADRSIDPASAVVAESRPSPSGRPWVYANMIASADGGTAVDGRSGQLGGPGDKAMFTALRSMADVILVGASTVRQERYRVPKMSEEIVAERRERGQADQPRLAIVSRSLDFEKDLPVFDDPSNRPYLVTVASAPADRLAGLKPLTEVVTAGEQDVDLGTAMAELHRRGARRALSEGGPTINGQLVAENLIDEWNLSIAPSLLGGDSRRAAVGPVTDGPPAGMRLGRVWADDDFLFCRWVRRDPSPGGTD